jgi:hypothetical protein
LLRRIETEEGTLDVFVAAWRTGGVCFGYVSSIAGFEPYITGCPANERTDDQPTSFDSGEMFIERVAPSIFVVDGTPPPGATSMRLRFEDGTSEEPDIFTASTFVTWLGRIAYVRPTAPPSWSPSMRTGAQSQASRLPQSNSRLADDPDPRATRRALQAAPVSGLNSTLGVRSASS